MNKREPALLNRLTSFRVAQTNTCMTPGKGKPAHQLLYTWTLTGIVKTLSSGCQGKKTIFYYHFSLHALSQCRTITPTKTPSC